MSGEGAGPPRPSGVLLNWLLGIIGSLVVIGIATALGLMISLGNRLTSLEATMGGNRNVREQLDIALDKRLDRVEQDVREIRSDHRGERERRKGGE